MRKGRQAALTGLCAPSSPFCPLFLLQPSPSTPELPWQSGLTPAAYQRTHFVPMPLKQPLQFITLSLRVLFIYTAHEPLCPDHRRHHLLAVSTHICKLIKAEIQLSFFWPPLLTKSTAFMVWGYVKEQRPFNLQHSCLLHRKHLFQPRSRKANLTAPQSSGLPDCTSNFILSICSSKG